MTVATLVSPGTAQPGVTRRVCPLRNLIPRSPIKPAQPEPRQTNPPPAECSRVLLGVVEVLIGRRAVNTLTGWITESVRKTLISEVHDPKWRAGQIASVRTQMPVYTATEAAVRVLAHGRSTACAVRLDRVNGRWIATDIQLP